MKVGEDVAPDGFPLGEVKRGFDVGIGHPAELGDF